MHTHKQIYMDISEPKCRKTKIKISKADREKKITKTNDQYFLFFRKLYKQKDNRVER